MARDADAQVVANCMTVLQQACPGGRSQAPVAQDVRCRAWAGRTGWGCAREWVSRGVVTAAPAARRPHALLPAPAPPAGCCRSGMLAALRRPAWSIMLLYRERRAGAGVRRSKRPPAAGCRQAGTVTGVLARPARDSSDPQLVGHEGHGAGWCRVTNTGCVLAAGRPGAELLLARRRHPAAQPHQGAPRAGLPRAPSAWPAAPTPLPCRM